jgi:hypothetical protein
MAEIIVWSLEIGSGQDYTIGRAFCHFSLPNHSYILFVEI